MVTTSKRPLPAPTHYSKPFWDAAAQHRLVVQHCGDCDRSIMYPKRYCSFCLSDNLGWRDATGRGTVYTFAVQERGGPSGFDDGVPYVLAVIRLEEGVQMMSNIIGPDALDVACGDEVEVEFEKVEGADIVLPVFRRKQPSRVQP